MKKTLSILMLLASCTVASRGNAQITFSPAAGTYTGTKTVSITCSPSTGTTIWYTTNGYPASTASTKYTGPISVSSTTTINAICATTSAVDEEVNVQDATTGWKCNAPNAPVTSNGWTCEASGGVSGSLSSFDFTVGSPAFMTASTEATGPTNALLFVHTPSTTCDTCTTLTQHLSVEPTAGTSVITRNEMDMEQCCDTTTKALRQASLQCNGSVWEIDASGAWDPTTIACDLPTGSQTDVVYEAEWVNGDTGCGGNGCMYLNALTINGTRYFPLAQYCNSSYPSCAISPMVTQPTWGHFGAGNQHQIGLNGTTGCGASPCTGGRYIYTNNVTTAEGTVGTGSSTYTIASTQTATPVITLSTGTYVMPTNTYITDATSSNGISWCYAASGPCTPDTAYTSGSSIYVDPASGETICANATATGYSESATSCASYVTASAATAQPSITLATGTYTMPTSTTITDSATGAAVLWCYVASGTCTPSTVYTGSIYIDPASAETICASGWAAGKGQSTAVCHTYTAN